MKEHLMLHHFSCFVCFVFHPTRKLRIGGFALLCSFIRGCLLLFSLCSYLYRLYLPRYGCVCVWVSLCVCVPLKVLQKCLFTFKSELDNRNSRKQWSEVGAFVVVWKCRHEWLRIGLFCLCGFDSLYCIGKNIYSFYCSLFTFCFHPAIQNNWIRLFILLECIYSCCCCSCCCCCCYFACTCLSECVCVFAALLLVVRFVLFLYWYIMEEFELPWAIISFISLLALCMCLLL